MQSPSPVPRDRSVYDSVICIDPAPPEPLSPSRSGRAQSDVGRRQLDKPRLALAIVAVLHGLLPLALLGAHHFYGHDEVVYLSQYSGHSPAAHFSAPRSRGTPLLVAPVTALTSSVVVLRVYLAALSGIGTYLAFVPWFKALARQRRPVSPYVVPFAAFLLSTLWVSIYYSFEAMPNQWSMFGVVAAAGLVLSADRRPTKRTVLGIILALGLAGLFRPQDSLWPGLALLASVGFFYDRTVSERLRLAGIVAVGLVAGWIDWIVEAYAYYQGPANRINESLAVNGGTGIHFSLGAQWSVLNGPLLCRNGCQASPVLLDQLWWVVGGALVAVAVVVAHRLGATRIVLVSIACGLAVIAEYTISVTYGAPRFLLPAYGLLSIPVAMAALWLLRVLWRPLIPLFVAGCVAQVAIQTHALLATVNAPIEQHAQKVIALDDQLAGMGISQPGCVTYWDKSGTVSDYVLGCRNYPLHDSVLSPLPAAAASSHVYVLAGHRPKQPTWFTGWPHGVLDVRGNPLHFWLVRPAPPVVQFAIPRTRPGSARS